MPSSIENGTGRMILHTAYVPANQNAQYAAFWQQYNGVQFNGNLSNSHQNQMLTQHTHDERLDEEKRFRQKFGS